MRKLSYENFAHGRIRPRIECAGFTVFELIVSVLIASLALGVAVPKLSELTTSFQRVNAKAYLIEDLKRAQAKTITEGCRGIFKIASDGKSYRFGCDYLSYDVSATPNYDTINFTRILPQRITLTADAQVIFNSRGQSVDANDVISNVTIRLRDHLGGTTSEYAHGTLLGTGVFRYD